MLFAFFMPVEEARQRGLSRAPGPSTAVFPTASAQALFVAGSSSVLLRPVDPGSQGAGVLQFLFPAGG